MDKLYTAIGVRVALVLGSLSAPSLKRDEGQTFVEYALILALIGVALTVALTTLRGQIAGIFTQIGNDL